MSESVLSIQSHKPFESESSKIFSSQSRQNHDLVESESSHKNSRVATSHWFSSSSQSRVTQNFTFFLRHFLTMKWRPTCHEMASDKLENGAKHAVKWPPISYKIVPNVV